LRMPSLDWGRAKPMGDIELLDRVHARNLVDWARDKPRVLVLSADLTGSTEIDLFRDAYPGRFFSMGMAEQNMLSFAGGLAREGFLPLVHTFAVFISRRAYDQIAMSVAYPNLPVRLFGFLPGITTPGGATHQAIEDIALMRTLPNMTVLECGAATDVESVLDVAYEVQGPVYIRMLRGQIPRLFAEPMRLNRARVLSTGTEVTIFSSGICTEQAIRAVHALQERGLSLTPAHISTLKPFSDPQVLAVAAQARCGVITFENHTIVGGLGTAVAEVMAAAGLGKPLVRMGLQDTFAHGASREYLMHEYGLDCMALVQQVEKLVGARFDISEQDLAHVRLGKGYGKSKEEDL